MQVFEPANGSPNWIWMWILGALVIPYTIFCLIIKRYRDVKFPKWLNKVALLLFVIYAGFFFLMIFSVYYPNSFLDPGNIWPLALLFNAWFAALVSALIYTISLLFIPSRGPDNEKEITIGSNNVEPSVVFKTIKTLFIWVGFFIATILGFFLVMLLTRSYY